jgi:hypothetical protein
MPRLRWSQPACDDLCRPYLWQAAQRKRPKVEKFFRAA